MQLQPVGGIDGKEVGLSVGAGLGETVGETVGAGDVGAVDGDGVGAGVGAAVGSGEFEGAGDGGDVGTVDGDAVGGDVGIGDGTPEGCSVMYVGSDVGRGDGRGVSEGADVGGQTIAPKRQQAWRRHYTGNYAHSSRANCGKGSARHSGLGTFCIERLCKRDARACTKALQGPDMRLRTRLWAHPWAHHP